MSIKTDVKPPVFISGGKRLNFSRRDEYTDDLTEGFHGFGKDTGCYPSADWEELCAFAALIVAHPAYVEPGEPPAYSPPMIEDEETPGA